MSTRHLKTIENRLFWLSHWMIHHANHIRPKTDGIKIGGHQASSASMVSIMTALYFSALRPEDRVAVKPHASPVFHAIQYLMGNQTREKMENFRDFGGVQSYPSRTKDIDDVDFSTGSVGLGVAITPFASLVQDYIDAKSWSKGRALGRMIAAQAGAGAMLLLFFICAIGGGIAFAWLSETQIPAIGASGAVFGFLGLWQYWEAMIRRARNQSLRPVIGTVFALVLINVLLALYMQGLLAWQAHLGGFVAGVAMGPVMTNYARRRGSRRV